MFVHLKGKGHKNHFACDSTNFEHGSALNALATKQVFLNWFKTQSNGTSFTPLRLGLLILDY